jgi:hypothetical protein
VLSTPLDSDLWMLMLHQLFHARASWGRSIGSTLFDALRDEVRSSGSELFAARDWTGRRRELGFDELMARMDRFPADYAKQLLKEVLTRAPTDHGPQTPSALQALATPHGSPTKPRRDASFSLGHSLVPAPSVAATVSLFECGSKALLPALRRSAPDSAASANILHALRHRQSGTSAARLVAERSSAAADKARTNEMYVRRMRKLKVVTGHKDAIYWSAHTLPIVHAFFSSPPYPFDLADASHHSCTLCASFNRNHNQCFV